MLSISASRSVSSVSLTWFSIPHLSNSSSITVHRSPSTAVHAYSHRRAILRATTNSTTADPDSTETCGHSAVIGSSRQKIFVNPSIAHALIVNNPAFCIDSGIRNRGNMLPPIDDMIRMTSVESAPSCARVWHTLASSIPNDATANDVNTPITTNPGMC